MRIRLLKPLTLVIVALLVAGCRGTLPYQGMLAADLYALAVTSFDEGAYEEAQLALDRIFILFPSYEQAPEAQLLLAETHFRREQFVTASAEYGYFVDRYPDHPSAPDAGMGRCRSAASLSPSIQRDQEPTEEAFVLCSNMAADYPGTAAAAVAETIAEQMRVKVAEKFYSIASYYFRRHFYESSITYYETIENDYADTSWAPKALLGIMKAYEQIGYQDLVEETRQKILDSYPTSEEARDLADDPAPQAATPGGAEL
jgi:outer membrane protein assembly factor BamD